MNKTTNEDLDAMGRYHAPDDIVSEATVTISAAEYRALRGVVLDYIANVLPDYKHLQVYEEMRDMAYKAIDWGDGDASR